ncbi:serine protease inhibitor ecotin [Shewanella sp. MMG014]|uniref:serine protease inhibitor ecotin n=1 Tax=unclassified Shewanella TaxID=196818 RepID=UPI0009EF4FEA|nr:MULTISPECIES: serine protease inhibitor ecotin [unclassified Shewanella]MBQ4888868.1 serine protease inhibitor ecotin [Shewanella sp. MMG014]
MKNILNTTLKSLTKLSALSLLTAMTFSAAATSPVPNQFEKPQMITTYKYSQDNYQVVDAAKMFPKPSANQVQHILSLDTLENEADYKIEIQIGQNKLVDCNRHHLSGKLDKISLQGWGYQYYSVEQLTDGPTTMMMCPDPKTMKFVTMGKSLMIDYDSRLPKVFYLPEGAELRYRVWQVKDTYQFAGQ